MAKEFDQWWKGLEKGLGKDLEEDIEANSWVYGY